ncbi:hypothetical protein ACJJTC_017447 [Scirpophaga incertulas]
MSRDVASLYPMPSLPSLGVVRRFPIPVTGSLGRCTRAWESRSTISNIDSIILVHVNQNWNDLPNGCTHAYLLKENQSIVSHTGSPDLAGRSLDLTDSGDLGIGSALRALIEP